MVDVIRNSINVEPKKKLSRRDFLKVAGAGTLALAGSQAAPYLFRSPESTFIPTMEGDFGVEKETVLAFHRLNKLDAVTVAVSDSSQPDSLRDSVLTRYNLESGVVDSLASKDDKHISVSDVTGILTASVVSGRPLPESVSFLVKAPDNPDDLSHISSQLANHNSIEEWRGIVSEAGLEQGLIMMGRPGKEILETLGIDIESLEFQTKLISPNLAEQVSQLEAEFMHIKGENGSSTVVVRTGEDADVYEFYEGIEKESTLVANYVFDRIQTLESCSDEAFKNCDSEKFTMFQSWVYDMYKSGVIRSGEVNDEAFFNSAIFTAENSSTSRDRRVVQRVNHLLEYLKKSGLTNDAAHGLITDAARGNVSSFNVIMDTVDPGALTIFNTKAVYSGESNSYREILTKATKGGLTKQSILTAFKEYSGNLYLLKVADKTASQEIDVHQFIPKPESKYELATKLLADNITIETFADELFGIRKIIIADIDGNVNGNVTLGRISENITEVPNEFLTLLKATEGNSWTSGKRYLERFIGRNLLAAVTDRPNSGGSDPTMQLMKMLCPSQYDYGSFGGDKEKDKAIFHRPDLYGYAYLSKLYYAVRDEKAVHEIYNMPVGGVDTDGLGTNKIGQICAKLENYLLARDFRNKFGEDKMLDIYTKFVPLGNTREGLQIQGFEAGSNYYFNKSLKDLNQGEMAVLVGLIQAPLIYTPNQYVNGEWTVDPTSAIERGLTVARLAEDNAGLNAEQIEREIKNVQFSLEMPKSWYTMDVSNIAPGTFMNRPVPLGNGLGVLWQSRTEKKPSKLPETITLTKIQAERQKEYDIWFDNVIDNDQLRLITREDGEVSNTLNELWDVIAASPGNADYKETALQVRRWLYENGIDEYSDSGLIARLNVLSQASVTNPWQCGQAALLVNDIMRIKFGLSTPPFSGTAGGVKNWVKELGDREEVVLDGYHILRMDSAIAEGRACDVLNVGDMVVSWNSMGMDDSEDPGHVCIVKDKGVDSSGRVYVKVIDSNFDRMGEIRDQTLWNDSLPKLIYPGTRYHSAVIRANSNLPQGKEVSFKDTVFGEEVMFATVQGNRVTVPGMRQQLLNSRGEYETVVNPGVTVAIFDKEGFKAGIDQTNLLEASPVPIGNALKPFLYAFYRTKNMAGKEDKVNFFPKSALTLDGSDVTVMNPPSMIMNLDIEGKVTFAEALANGMDVPFQERFIGLVVANPHTWEEFTEFMERFGINFVDLAGNKLSEPTALAATGRDLYVESLDSLGFGLSVLANPDEYFDDNDRELKDILQETVGVLMNDKLRTGLTIRGVNPEEAEIGTDMFNPSVTNAVSTTVFNGKSVVVANTNIGQEGVSFSLLQDGDGYVVGVMRVRGGDESKNTTSSLRRLHKVGRGAGVVGFPSIMADAISQ